MNAMQRGIDHLVLATRDLNQQSAFYRKLGFQVGAQNRHDWGTLNRIVQFDGAFLELLTIEDGFKRLEPDQPIAQFANVLDDYLASREGLAMLVLSSQDASADQSDFEAHGIAGTKTAYFARQATRPDGTSIKVAFSLAFARPRKSTAAGFFVCQQHAPEAFWNSAYQVHPNQVAGIDAIVFQASVPADFDNFFCAYTGKPISIPVPGGQRIETQRGAIECLTPEAVTCMFGSDAVPQSDHEPAFAAIRFRTTDLGATEHQLNHGGVPYCKNASRLIVPAHAAYGVTLSFECT